MYKKVTAELSYYISPSQTCAAPARNEEDRVLDPCFLGGRVLPLNLLLLSFNDQLALLSMLGFAERD
eukprot:1754783-Amphidinium_carterae.1